MNYENFTSVDHPQTIISSNILHHILDQISLARVQLVSVTETIRSLGMSILNAKGRLHLDNAFSFVLHGLMTNVENQAQLVCEVERFDQLLLDCANDMDRYAPGLIIAAYRLEESFSIELP